MDFQQVAAVATITLALISVIVGITVTVIGHYQDKMIRKIIWKAYWLGQENWKASMLKSIEIVSEAFPERRI